MYIMGVSENRGFLFGGPFKGFFSILGINGGTPIVGNTQMCTTEQVIWVCMSSSIAAVILCTCSVCVYVDGSGFWSFEG